MLLFNAVYIQANLEDDIVKEALKTVSFHSDRHFTIFITHSTQCLQWSVSLEKMSYVSALGIFCR